MSRSSGFVVVTSTGGFPTPEDNEWSHRRSTDRTLARILDTPGTLAHHEHPRVLNSLATHGAYGRRPELLFSMRTARLPRLPKRWLPSSCPDTRNSVRRHVNGTSVPASFHSFR